MVHSKSTKSDVFSYKCTCPTFVLVQRLYQSDVCIGPTFVLVRHLCVRRLYCPTFVASDVCGSDVCTGTKDNNAQFTTIPLKAFSAKVSCFKETLEKCMHRINNFLSKKNDVIFHIFDQMKISRVSYHLKLRLQSL